MLTSNTAYIFFASYLAWATNNKNNKRSSKQNMKLHSAKTAYALVFATIASLPFSTIAEIQFQDVSATAGITQSSETWGGQWGDINGDNRPDLFINNHRNRPNFYRNNGDGTFTDIALQIMDFPAWMDMESYDLHGGAFADVDNDGDTDLFIRTGTDFRNLLFINENGVLNEHGLDNGIGQTNSGKAVLMVDYNKDGLIDILTGSGNWKGNGNGTFVDANSEIINACEHLTNTLLATDYNDDGIAEIICGLEGNFPRKVLGTQQLPFSDLTDDFISTSLVNDSLSADLDGDLDIDFFLLRGFLRPNQATLVNSMQIEAWVQGHENKNKGFEFAATGPITITTDSTFFRQRTDIFIGENEINPTSAAGFGGKLSFTLNPVSSDVTGISSTTTGNNRIHIGLVNGVWKIELPASTNSTRGYITVKATQAIQSLSLLNQGPIDGPQIHSLLINSPQGFVNEAGLRGFSAPASCVSAVTADFDNDMDLDIYLACTDSVSNLPNQLYLNDGQGNFTQTLSHGAEGAIGVGLDSKAGTADSAFIADFDLDGRMDIALVNGMGLRPLHIGGPHQLIRNTSTNDNHWIELKLVGTLSNRDAMGAKVFVTTSDGTVQLRELNQSHHRWGHSDKTVHFGLGQHDMATINIEWPNGATDTFSDLSANTFYSLTEKGNADEILLGAIPALPTATADDRCGEPAFSDDIANITLLWKDCSTNTWHFRVNKSSDPATVTHSGQIVSPQQIQNIVLANIEQDDSVDLSEPSAITYALNTDNHSHDEMSFQIADDLHSCFTVPPGTEILVGPHFRSLTATEFNLENFESCASVILPVDPVSLTITEDSNDDGVINSSEMNGEVDVSVGLPAGLLENNTVNIADNNGNSQTISLTTANLAGPVNVTFPTPAHGNTLSVSATITNGSNSTGGEVSDSAIIITTVSAPGSIVITEDTNNDGVINSSELDDQIGISIELPPGLSAGDSVSVLDNQSNTQNFELTSANLAGPITSNFPAPANGETITLSAFITDRFNNVSTTVIDSATLNTIAPVSTSITITEDTNNDGIISSKELVGDININVALPSGLAVGHTVTITDGNGNTQAITLTASNLAGPILISFPAPTNGGRINANATITDNFGNTSTAVTDSATIKTSAPMPISIIITEDANNDGVISGKELVGDINTNVALPGGLAVGQTVTITDGNGNTQAITLTASNLDGPIPISFPVPTSGGRINANATITDNFGNTSAAVTDRATIKTSAPMPISIIITEDVNNDGVINSSELDDQLGISIELPPGLSAGDSVSVLDSQSNTQNFELTSANLAGPITSNFPAPANGETITLSAFITDRFNNVSTTVFDSATINTIAPVSTSITITEDTNNDGIISSKELVGNININVALPDNLSVGDTVTITDGNGNAQTVTLTANNLTGPILISFPPPISNNRVNVSVTITDNFGNTSTAVTDSATINTTALMPVSIVITEDENNDGIISANELHSLIDIRVALPAGLAAGDTVTISDDNGHTQTINLTSINLAGPVDANIPNPGDGNVINVRASITNNLNNTSNEVTDSATINTAGSIDTEPQAGGGGCAISSRSPFIPAEWLLLLIAISFRRYWPHQRSSK